MRFHAPTLLAALITAAIVSVILAMYITFVIVILGADS